MKRNQIITNVLNRSRSFTTAQIASRTESSLRHTRRVLSELVRRGDLVAERISGTVLYTVL